LVVKYISLYQSIVLKSNKFLDYNFVSSDYDPIIIGLYDSCFKTRLNNILSKVSFSEKELVSHIDFFMAVSDIYYMKNKLVQEELLFSIIKHPVLKDYEDYCYDYDNLDINYDNITMYFIPVDNYSDEVLDNIINRYDV